MNQLHNIFSIPVYIGEVKEKEALNASLLNSTVIKENKLKVYERFCGDFLSSFENHKYLEEEEPWVDDLLGEIMLGLREYVKAITKKEKSLPCSIELLDVWFNSYEKGQYQEAHDHLVYGLSSPFSFIYYLKLPKDSPGATMFLNDGYAKCRHYYSNNLSITTPNISFPIKEGHYIIFPSFLTHFVVHHNSKNEQRITVAGNIELRYEDDPA